MKWFTIVFGNSRYESVLTEEFIKKFESVYNAFKQPDGLCLYRVNSVNEDNNQFYISIPLDLAFYIQIPLSVYNVESTKPPDKKDIHLIAGSPNPNASDELIV